MIFFFLPFTSKHHSHLVDPLSAINLTGIIVFEVYSLPDVGQVCGLKLGFMVVCKNIFLEPSCITMMLFLLRRTLVQLVQYAAIRYIKSQQGVIFECTTNSNLK